MIRINVGAYDKTARVGEAAAIRFELESDSPVKAVTVDFLGDGVDGLTVAGKDLRRLRGVFIEPQKSGAFSWQVTAVNERGERDQTGSTRPIAVQE